MIGVRLGGRYEVTGELGRGGMGTVYRARDPLLSRDVAIKVLPAAILTPEAEERFQREAEVVAQMDHPSIVPIYDIGRHDGSLFFVMPVVQGTSLRTLIKERSLKLGEVLDIGIDVTQALQYSHERGVVHRDIKPENVMVARTERELRVRVMDFGLAVRSTEERLTKSGSLVGTVVYLAPEQVASRAVDARTDLYAFGAVLYECLMGEPPFTGDLHSVLYRIVHDRPRAPRPPGGGPAEELGQVTLRCLQKEPAQRFASAAELGDELRRCRHRLAEEDRQQAVGVSSVWTLDLKRPAASELIGRDRELGELADRLNLATAGECQLVLVAGEPGVGKTRLLKELETLARARKVRVLHGRFVELDRAFPYQGFCEVIQEHFRVWEGSKRRVIDVGDIAGDLLALFPVLNEVPELRGASSETRRPAADSGKRTEDRMAVFELLARTLTRIAGGRPLVVILENLHRGEVSLDALAYIVRRLGTTLTLFAGSYRTTEVDRRHPLTRLLASFSDDPRFSKLVLGPLPVEEHRQFVAGLLPEGKGSAEFADQLYQATEGNPFFTRELVQSLVDSGGLVRTDTQTYRLAAPISGMLPATIQQAVEQRLARFPEELTEVLAIASVLGRSFDVRSLAALAGDADVDDAVDKLAQQGLLEEERGSRGDRLVFSSGIVREVLYGGMPRRKRKALHRRYGEELERRHAGRLARVYPELLYHFSQGDVPEKSVRYGLLAAKAALEAFGPEDALRAARAVLDFAASEDWEGGRAAEAEARLLMARAHRLEGSLEAALSQAEKAAKVFEEAVDPGGEARALALLAELAWDGRQVEDARRYSERGIEKARGVEEREALLRCLSLAATLANLRGDYGAAREHLEEAERLRAPTPRERTEEVPEGGTLLVGMAGEVKAREPSEIDLVEEEEILSNVFETLTSVDAGGNLVPGLAESWEVLDGGTRLVLRLREGVTFQDGAPCTALDVVASFERVRGARQELPAALAVLDRVAALSDRELEIRLKEPLPIYPSLLTDVATAIVHDTGQELVGTGPFRLASHQPGRVVLARNAAVWTGTPPHLARVEFRTGMAPAAIAIGLRSGELDLARDLLPQDLDDLLREPRLRHRLFEAAKKSSYFVLFNVNAPAVAGVDVRRLLAGVLRPTELVWRTAGRFAEAATGILPPGVLGHDPGRRRASLAREKAAPLLASAGVDGLVLQAAVHPVFLGRYAAILTALFDAWRDVGVTVRVATPDMASFLATTSASEGIDLRIGRWIADYPDPDAFTHGLFHSRHGRLRGYFASRESDVMLDAARAEPRVQAREALYHRFEAQLLDQAVVVPLFHDVDYRIAHPAVRGFALRSSPPYVNYAALGKAERVPAASPARDGGGVLHVPVPAEITSLDPAASATVEEAEVLPNVFESLTRVVEGARVIPWLAEEITGEDAGRRYRIRLRERVRFHDGRRLTARDVRFTFERLLANPLGDARFRLSVIRGARDVAAGRARELAGFRILSASEFIVELETPVALFSALLADSAAAIVPEGTETLEGTWKEGCVGTGPFRIARFVPGERLELERNPIYWREGVPKSDALVFHFGMKPEDILREFKDGALSLASDLLPHDVEALRHDPLYAAGGREIPLLSTYFVAFNVHRAPLDNRELRRRLRDCVDTAAIVRKTLGRLGVPARSLIPPGLLGYERERLGSSGTLPMVVADGEVTEPQTPTCELTAVVNPIFFGQYAEVTRELYTAFKAKGVRVHPLNRTWPEFNEARTAANADLYVGRWVADYPDADTFAQGVLHTKEGNIGRFCGSLELDDLVDRARIEPDPSVRHALYRHIEDTLGREALLIPLFHEQVYRFARPEVAGLEITFSTPPIVAYENLWVRK